VADIIFGEPCLFPFAYAGVDFPPWGTLPLLFAYAVVDFPPWGTLPLLFAYAVVDFPPWGTLPLLLVYALADFSSLGKAASSPLLMQWRIFPP
jgi:hypothetical protein